MWPLFETRLQVHDGQKKLSWHLPNLFLLRSIVKCSSVPSLQIIYQLDEISSSHNSPTIIGLANINFLGDTK